MPAPSAPARACAPAHHPIRSTAVACDDYSTLTGLFVVAPIGGLIGAAVGAILAPESWEAVPAGVIEVAGPGRCR
jgi:hypothetical protein